MSKAKIVVYEMPKTSMECPFAIYNKNYPCVCDLKRDKDSQFGISFSKNQYCNCSLDMNEKCDNLIPLNK